MGVRIRDRFRRRPVWIERWVVDDESDLRITTWIVRIFKEGNLPAIQGGTHVKLGAPNQCSLACGYHVINLRPLQVPAPDTPLARTNLLRMLLVIVR